MGFGISVTHATALAPLLGNSMTVDKLLRFSSHGGTFSEVGITITFYIADVRVKGKCMRAVDGTWWPSTNISFLPMIAYLFSKIILSRFHLLGPRLIGVITS